MFKLPSFRFWSRAGEMSGSGVGLAPVPVHDVEMSPDRSTRTLKHLIRANHVNYSIAVEGKDQEQGDGSSKLNQTSQVLASAFLLGADHQELVRLYETRNVHPSRGWEASPSEVARHDWRNWLGDIRYQRAYVDFFEDELVRFDYDWKRLLGDYLFQGEQPLIHSAMSGAAYPLIHLGFAYELSSPTLAIEALASAAILYGDQHKYLEDPIYTTSPENSTSSLLEILGRVQGDISFDGLSDVSSLMDRAREISQHHRRTVLEYWNSWSITDVSVQLRDSQRLAVLLLTASTIASSGHVEENTREITFLPALKASRALRILLPLVPARFHIALLRQWWLSVLSIYILHRRPSVDPARISGQMFEHGRLDGDEDWNELKRMASLLYAVEDADRLQAVHAIRDVALSSSSSASSSAHQKGQSKPRSTDQGHDANHPFSNDWFLRAAFSMFEKNHHEPEEERE